MSQAEARGEWTGSALQRGVEERLNRTLTKDEQKWLEAFAKRNQLPATLGAGEDWQGYYANAATFIFQRREQARRRDEERFWPLVNKDEGDGCWVWQGALSPDGYGKHGRELAHKHAYQAMVGEVPAGMTLDHGCNRRDCVRPDHLEPVSHAENCHRAAQRRATCKRGHPWVDENVYRYSYGGLNVRKCKACTKRRSQEYHEQRKKAKEEGQCLDGSTQGAGSSSSI